MDKSSGMLINLIVKAYSGAMIQKLVDDLLGIYEDLANFPKDRVETLSNGVFVCLGMCIHTAKRRRDPLDSELLIRIYKDSNKLIRATGILPREYIFLARRVATGAGDKFDPYAIEYLSLLEECLRNPSNNQLVMEAYQAFGELSVAGFQALTDGYVEQFLMYSILQRLQSNATCVEDKMIMFKVLSELSLGNLREFLFNIR